MESLEKKFDDDFLYRMRDEVLQKVEKSVEFQELSREADALSERFPVITDLLEGTQMEKAECRDKVVEALIQLLKKKKVLIM